MITVLNGEEIDLPEALLESEEVFRSVMNSQSWNHLNDEEKYHLKAYLPTEVTRDETETETIIKSVLDTNEVFQFANPVNDAYKKIKAGLFLPKVLKQLKKCKKMKYKNYKMNQKQYYQNLLKEIILSRQNIIENFVRHGAGFVVQKRLLSGNSSPSTQEVAMKKYLKTIREIKTECEEEGFSSDDEFMNTSMSFEYAVPERLQEVVRDVAAVSRTQTSSKSLGTNDANYKRMLSKHRKKRLWNQAHPNMNTTNISLADVILRASPPKKGRKKLKKQRIAEVSPEEPQQFEEAPPPEMAAEEEVTLHQSPEKCAAVMTTTTATTTSGDGGADVSAAGGSSGESGNNVQVEPVYEQTCMADIISKSEIEMDEEGEGGNAEVEDGMSSFFSVIAFLFQKEENSICTQAVIEESIAVWQGQKASEKHAWRMLYPNWVPLVSYALQYLSGGGTAALLRDFVPFIHWQEDHMAWKWIGPEYVKSSVIVPLSNHWLETLNQAMKMMQASPTKRTRNGTTIDLDWTDHFVRETTIEEKEVYRKQETERYQQPHLPFIYTTHGYQSIVGPVKGVFSLKDSGNKARDHFMLISDRPAYVTILCLVKDAVARLPNGEGTRADVCSLMKDSQYLNTTVTDSQIHTVVSGALDRLHAERDPCVKYDGARKVWSYLHRTRSIEEFKRLHEISAAEAAAKKQETAKSKSKALRGRCQGDPPAEKRPYKSRKHIKIEQQEDPLKQLYEEDRKRKSSKRKISLSGGDSMTSSAKRSVVVMTAEEQLAAEALRLYEQEQATLSLMGVEFGEPVEEEVMQDDSNYDNPGDVIADGHVESHAEYLTEGCFEYDGMYQEEQTVDGANTQDMGQTVTQPHFSVFVNNPNEIAHQTVDGAMLANEISDGLSAGNQFVKIQNNAPFSQQSFIPNSLSLVEETGMPQKLHSGIFASTTAATPSLNILPDRTHERQASVASVQSLIMQIGNSGTRSPFAQSQSQPSSAAMPVPANPPLAVSPQMVLRGQMNRDVSHILSAAPMLQKPVMTALRAPTPAIAASSRAVAPGSRSIISGLTHSSSTGRSTESSSLSEHLLQAIKQKQAMRQASSSTGPTALSQLQRTISLPAMPAARSQLPYSISTPIRVPSHMTSLLANQLRPSKLPAIASATRPTVSLVKETTSTSKQAIVSASSIRLPTTGMKISPQQTVAAVTSRTSTLISSPMVMPSSGGTIAPFHSLAMPGASPAQVVMSKPTSRAVPAALSTGTGIRLAVAGSGGQTFTLKQLVDAAKNVKAPVSVDGTKVAMPGTPHTTSIQALLVAMQQQQRQQQLLKLQTLVASSSVSSPSSIGQAQPLTIGSISGIPKSSSATSVAAGIPIVVQAPKPTTLTQSLPAAVNAPPQILLSAAATTPPQVLLQAAASGQAATSQSRVVHLTPAQAANLFSGQRIVPQSQPLAGTGVRSSAPLKISLPRTLAAAVPRTPKLALPRTPKLALPRTPMTALPRTPMPALPNASVMQAILRQIPPGSRLILAQPGGASNSAAPQTANALAMLSAAGFTVSRSTTPTTCTSATTTVTSS